jgi:hypothetical protein
MKNIHILPTDNQYKGSISLTPDGRLSTNVLIGIPQHIYITSDEEIKKGDYVINNLDKLIGKSIRELNSGEIKDREYSKIILTTDQDLIKDGVQAIDDEFLEWFVKNPSCEFVELDVDLSKHNGQFQTKYGWKIIIPEEEPKQLFTKGDKVLFTGKMLNEEVVDKVVTVFYILGRGDITDMSEIVDEYAHIYKVWNKDLKHIPKEEPKQKVICTNDICQGECVECNFMTIVNVEEPKQETLEEAKNNAWDNYEHVEGNLYSTSFKNGFEIGAKWQKERMYSEEEVIFFIKEALNYSSLHYNRVSVDDWFEQFKKK